MSQTMNNMNSMVQKKEEKKSCQQHQHQQQSLARLVTLFAIVAVIFAQSVLVPAAEARYLPTRSNVDQLKRQEIKEILRLLLDLPESEQRESAQQQSLWSNGGRLADLYELSAIRAGAGAGRHTPSAADMAAVVSMEQQGGADSARAKRDVNKLANKVHF